MVVHLYNPNVRGAEAGEFLELTGWPVYPNQQDTGTRERP